jgi:serine/threonine protein kinase
MYSLRAHKHAMMIHTCVLLIRGCSLALPLSVSLYVSLTEMHAVVLGVKYDHALDVWSVGCTLYELYTGRILFPGKTNNHMLRLIQEVRGRFPNKLLRRGQFAAQHFDEHYNFLGVEFDRLRNRVRRSPRPHVRSYLPTSSTHPPTCLTRGEHADTYMVTYKHAHYHHHRRDRAAAPPPPPPPNTAFDGVLTRRG